MPIGLPVAGAISQIGGSAVSVLGNYLASRHAYKQDREMWHMQNRYNAPRAQMQRLREAGLNPNLIYGSGVAGATGQAKEMPKYQRPGMEGLNTLPTVLGVLGQYQGIRNQRADETKTVADTQMTYTQMIREEINIQRDAIARDLKRLEYEYMSSPHYRLNADGSRTKISKSTYDFYMNQIVNLREQDKWYRINQNKLMQESITRLNTLNKYMDETQITGIAGNIMRVVGPILQVLMQLRGRGGTAPPMNPIGFQY